MRKSALIGCILHRATRDNQKRAMEEQEGKTRKKGGEKRRGMGEASAYRLAKAQHFI